MARAYFDRFSLTIAKGDAEYASHPGNCDQEVADLVAFPSIAAQLDAIGPELIQAELREQGAWDAAELEDNIANRHRIVWMACGDINRDAEEEN